MSTSLARCTTWRAGLLVGAALLLNACGAPPPPDDLVVRLDASCADCEAWVRCDGGSANAAVYDPSFDLYLVGGANFGNSLLRPFRSKERVPRPLTVYRQRPGANQVFDRSKEVGHTAYLDLVQFRIAVPEGVVDRKTGAWLGPDDSVRGTCRDVSAAEAGQLAELFPDS